MTATTDALRRAGRRAATLAAALLVAVPLGGAAGARVKAKDDRVEAAAGAPLTLPDAELLANDEGAALTVTAVGDPDRGRVERQASGETVYTPPSGYTGKDEFVYTVADPSGETDEATVRVTVVARAKPTFTSDPVTEATVGQRYEYRITATDPDGDALSFGNAGLPDWLSVDAGPPDDGAVTLQGTPSPDDVGEVELLFRVSDGTAPNSFSDQRFTITVRPAPPTARDDEADTDAGTPVVIEVLENDSGDDLVVTAVSDPPGGAATITDEGEEVTYTPDPGFSGQDSFTYTVTDDQGTTAQATVRVTVRPPANRAPTAAADAYSAVEDTPLTVPAPGVLANDTDPDGDALTATLVQTASNGTLSLQPGGSFTYTPAANFNGTDSFTYRASDGAATSAPATVTITVAAVNDAPAAAADAYGVTEDTPLTVEAPGVLANDTDPDGNALTAVLAGGVANGTLSLQADGSFTYTPNAGFSGTDSFTYRASDGAATSAPATVTLTVAAVNDPPVARNDDAAATAGGAVRVDVLANDTDPDGDALTVTAVGTPSKGTAQVVEGGAAVRYTPAATASGTDTFTYTVSDGTATATATVTVTITPANRAPVARADAFSPTEDVAFTAPPPGVLANDTDADGDALTAVLDRDVANGTLVLRANGSFTYTPDPDFNGSDSFAYRASDGEVTSAPATVTLTVAAANDAPTAQPNAYATAEDTPLTVAAPGVLGNDRDPDGDALTATLVQTVSNGALTLRPDGSFTYTPAADFDGQDTFTYRASDGAATSAAVTVTITVGGENDPPVAADDDVTTPEDTPVRIDVLAGDTDPDGDALTVLSVTQPEGGAAEVVEGGAAVRYTPDPDATGTDTFTYTVSDGNGGTDEGTVTVTVTAVNDPPRFTSEPDTTATEGALYAYVVTADDPDGDALTFSSDPLPDWLELTPSPDPDADAATLEGTPGPDDAGTYEIVLRVTDGTADTTQVFTIVVADAGDRPVARDDAATTPQDTPVVVDVLANDTGDRALAVTAVSDPPNGTATVEGGDVRYTPDAGFSGTDAFTYTVSDGTSTASATVTITVTAVNAPPVARDDAVTTAEDTPVTVAVLANDADPDGDPLAVVAVSDPAGGTAALVEGAVRYTPAPDFAGTDSFTYTVSDGELTATATVTVTVTPVDDPPVARPDVYVTDEDVALDVAAPGVLANDADPDDALTAELASDPENGALVFRADGSFTYTPDPDFVGRDDFTYRAVGGGVASDPTTVTVRVGGQNDAPVARPDAATTAEDTPVTVAVLANDTDPDGDPLSVASVVQPSNGVVTVSPDGATVTYTPDPDFNGSDAFSYAAADGSGETASASVSVTVTPVNDAPVAVDDAAATRAGEPVTVAVLANDRDPDGDPLSVAAVSAPQNGRAAVEGGAVRYTPDAGFSGTDAFTYTASDGAGGADLATVTVTVRPAQTVAVTAQAGSAAVGRPVTVAVAAGGFEASSAELFYRPAGGGAYRVAPLRRVDDGDYEGTIPADAVTIAGVDYYVVLAGNGVRATSPAAAPAESPRHLRVAIPQARVPTPLAPASYRMVALPLAPDDPSPLAVLGDDYGAYDPAVWRLFRWDPAADAYDEFPGAGPLVPGRAVWLISRAGGPFDVVDALSADASGPVAITLQPGWNQIGTPFGFAVAWDDVEGSDLVSPPAAWDGREYDPDQAVLEPWVGYFVENTTGAPVTLSAPPLAASVPAGAAPLAGTGYRLRLSLTGADVVDTQNVVGLDAAASAGRDRLDRGEPPPPGPHARLSFVDGGDRLARSVRPDGGAGAAWDAEVTATADLLAAPLALRVALTDERPLPAGYGRYVLDLDHGRALPVEGGAVALTLSAADPVRRLKVVVGTEAFAASVAGGVPLAPPAFGLERAAPNPVRSSAALAFDVPERGPATLDVVDVLGRRVAVVVDGDLAPGRHTATWRPDGLASGTYVLRLRAAGQTATQTVTVLR